MAHETPHASVRSRDFLQRGRSQLEDLVVTLMSIVHGMWRYRWGALAVAWLICLGGWIGVYAMPDSYRAQTRFYIDAESMIKRVVGDLAISGDVMMEVNILTRALMSQPQLEKTARMANLDLTSVTPEDHEALIADLGRRILLSKEGAENVFRITFEDSNRATAELVVQTLLDNFVEDALGERRSDSGAASAFIDEQIAEYERRLDEAEERLAKFKRDNIGLMPQETGDYYSRLQMATQTLEATRAELRLANERRTEYQQQLDGEEPVFGIVTPSSSGAAGEPAGANSSLIGRYEQELASLLIRYTDHHPEVIALKEQIARLRESPGAGVAPGPAQPEAGPLEARPLALEQNPVYQRMRMGLGETEVQIAALRTKLGAEEAEVTRLQGLVNTIPEIERELNAMNRDYDVTRQQYDELLKRRESLHLTGQVEQSGDQLQFRIIEPPRASLTPVGPNRPLFLTAVTVAAIGASIVLAFLLQQLNPVFQNRRELGEFTGLPVLGTLSLARNAQERASSRRRRLVFAGVAAALPVALGVAVVVHEPAHRLIGNLMSMVSV